MTRPAANRVRIVPGERFGRLLAHSLVKVDGRGQSWDFECEACGEHATRTVAYVRHRQRQGKTLACEACSRKAAREQRAG